MIVVGSGDLGLDKAALALEHGVAGASIVEIGDQVRGNADTARSRAGACRFT
jgi:hypothetical protein